MPEGCSKILAQACEAQYSGGAGIEATEPMDEEREEWSNEVAALQAVYENMVDILSPGSMCFKTALPQVSQTVGSIQVLQCRCFMLLLLCLVDTV